MELQDYRIDEIGRFYPAAEPHIVSVASIRVTNSVPEDKKDANVVYMLLLKLSDTIDIVLAGARMRV